MKTKIKLLDWSNGYELPEGKDYRNVAFLNTEYRIRNLRSESEKAFMNSIDFNDGHKEASKKYVHYTKKAFNPLWTKLIGKFWETDETRTYFLFIAEAAEDLWYEGYHDLALEILEELLMLDSPDHLGLRLYLMNWYIVEKQYDKMDILFQKFPKDHSNPLFLYPMALRNFLEHGAKHLDSHYYIQKAMSSNIIIPAIILLNAETGGDWLESFKPHSLEEAKNFDQIDPHLWNDEKSTIDWLKEEYEKFYDRISTLSEKLI